MHALALVNDILESPVGGNRDAVGAESAHVARFFEITQCQLSANIMITAIGTPRTTCSWKSQLEDPLFPVFLELLYVIFPQRPFERVVA